MSKRIMVVDDEADFTWSLRRLLESTRGYEVCEVNDSRTALATIRTFQPDLVLMDLMMPGIDGSELAAQMREDVALKTIPVVYLTALVTKQEICGPSLGAGQRRYLPKPVQLEELVECIERETGPSIVPAPPIG